MKRVIVLGVLAAFAFAAPESLVAQTSKNASRAPQDQRQSLKVDMPDKAQVVQEVSTLGNDELIGRIDWEKKIVYAVGDGVPPKDAVNPAQARARAKRAAIDEAYAGLIEAVQEVQVDAVSTTRDFINENRTVQTKVRGLVKNAVIEELKQASDGSYQVMMKMPMTGAGGLSPAVFPVHLTNVRPVSTVTHIKQGARMAASGNADSSGKPEAAPGKTASFTVEKHTSLVVDARGLGVRPALYPVVQTQSGEVVYNVAVADPNATVEDGLCTYRKSIEEVRKMPKVGERPMIVKATGTAGKYNVNIVISDEDGKRVVEANNLTPFLKWANVNIVID